MLIEIHKLHIIIVIIFLHYTNIILGTGNVDDHLSHDRIISSSSFSQPNSKMRKNIKLEAPYQLKKLDKYDLTDNVAQPALKSKVCGETIVKNRLSLQYPNVKHPTSFVAKRSSDLLEIESSEVSPSKNINNTEENYSNNCNTDSTGTFQTFVDMLNKIPSSAPSGNIVGLSQNPIGTSSNSFNKDEDAVILDSNRGSSYFNEARENNNNNAANYYLPSHSLLDSMRSPDQANSISEISMKDKIDLSTSRIVELDSKNPPPDWVFSSGENLAKSGGINLVLPDTHGNENPPDWIFSPPENLAKTKSKLVDDSDNDKYHKYNILQLHNAGLRAGLVDNADYEAQFDDRSNLASPYNSENERAIGLNEEFETNSKFRKRKLISKSRESRDGQKKVIDIGKESILSLDSLNDLRDLLIKNYVPSNNDFVPGKNKRRSLTNGKNIKSSDNTKGTIDLKKEVSRSKFDNGNISPTINNNSIANKTTLHPVNNIFSVKLNRTSYLAKTNSSERNTDGTNNKSIAISINSKPNLILKNLTPLVKEKSNNTLQSDRKSELLRNFPNTLSEKSNYYSIPKGVLVDNRDNPKINVEGSYMEHLLKNNNDFNKINESDESYVILRSKELQRMKNVLLNNFKQMIVNSDKKGDRVDTTCYYPWELSTIETCTQAESRPTSPSVGSISPNDGMEVISISSTDSQVADGVVSTTSPNSPEFDMNSSTNLQDFDKFSPTSQPTTSQESNVQEDTKPYDLSDLNTSTESGRQDDIFSRTTQQQSDQRSSPGLSDIYSNKLTENSGCQVDDSFTEGLYFLVPAKGVNAIKCALENSRKIYMGSSITGSFIASVDAPNMVAKDTLSHNPLSSNLTITNDTILRDTIEHILRNKKNQGTQLLQDEENEEESGQGARVIKLIG
ncbi:probable serine/threonine-protein kinase clkA [Nilaparvata lugens]|uniref:probable serine/threonine-protein kinase clkA n=1 Tax=Nilaparvata lugens TaxID=108931 RepID=UPI00193D1251|nr:probable serine/threonine-protein kinase clkA [Nilaparvata lugens]